jgi:hypothetical protein
VIQGYESHAFKSKFESWPVGNAAGNPGTEEGRGKVAGMSFSYEDIESSLLYADNNFVSFFQLY